MRACLGLVNTMLSGMFSYLSRLLVLLGPCHMFPRFRLMSKCIAISWLLRVLVDDGILLTLGGSGRSLSAAWGLLGKVLPSFAASAGSAPGSLIHSCSGVGGSSLASSWSYSTSAYRCLTCLTVAAYLQGTWVMGVDLTQPSIDEQAHAD